MRLTITPSLPLTSPFRGRVAMRATGVVMACLLTFSNVAWSQSSDSQFPVDRYAPPSGYSAGNRSSRSYYADRATHDQPMIAAPHAAQADYEEPIAPAPHRVASSPASFTPPIEPAQSVVPSPAAATGLKLPPRQAPRESIDRAKAPTSTTGALMTIGGALAAVLGLYFTLVVLGRKFAPGGNQTLPKEAVEVLGRTTLGRQQLQMIRIGGKLILVAMMPGSTETLTEITDPTEVERLTAMCRRSQPGSSTQTFQQVISQIEREPVPRGFLGENASSRGSGSSSSTARRVS